MERFGGPNAFAYAPVSRELKLAPAVHSGQLSLRSATPTVEPPSTAVNEPHTTWTPVSELKRLIPLELKSAPDVPPPALGTPIQWKYLKDPAK